MTWALSHIRAFVANQVMSQIRAFLGLFCPDFYSDIEDFTQILCGYLPKILAVKTSAEDEETNDNYVSEMCGILALFGADPQANSELRAELLR